MQLHNLCFESRAGIGRLVSRKNKFCPLPAVMQGRCPSRSSRGADCAPMICELKLAVPSALLGGHVELYIRNTEGRRTNALIRRISADAVSPMGSSPGESFFLAFEASDQVATCVGSVSRLHSPRGCRRSDSAEPSGALPPFPVQVSSRCARMLAREMEFRVGARSLSYTRTRLY